MRRCGRLLFIAALLALVRAGTEELYFQHATPYAQPQWHRRCDRCAGSEVHAILERAARLHQDGELEEAVQQLKAAISKDPKNGEAYASLGKALHDLGKPDLAEKALVKAKRIHHQGLQSAGLF
jgi:Flp pilus assembly protein TadD